ncbi:acyl-CoA thioesterase [Dyella halodurans]|uniref:Acyl-CoA thioesterase n=1 Tax=Dyella halodurans TaxID=1920171 RepID=A0ABV9C3P3_9GAMM|nr:thioesterase family protein [Dyella halodurans]
MSSSETAPKKRARANQAEAADPASVAPEAGTTSTQPGPLFVAPISVRWRDLDAFNHVNNANYLTYLEEARLHWLQHVPGWFDEQSMPVLAASEINYRRPIEWPAQLLVELACERLGNSSVTLAHRIIDADDRDRLYSDGRVVMVWMNPTTGKPVALPQAIRDAAEAAA